jgi:hypothetical protein
MVTGSVYVYVYVFVPEHVGSAPTTGPVIVSGDPQELFTAGGVGTTCALLIQGTVDPPLGGSVNVGGVTVIVAWAVVVHPLKSVTVTVYVPAKSPERSSVVAELLHIYVYGVVPPVTVRLISPVPSLQGRVSPVAEAESAAAG